MFFGQFKYNFLDDKLEFKHATVICKHFGPPTSRPKDHLRPNQNQFASHSPFIFRIVYQPALEKFVVQAKGINLKHTEKPLCLRDIYFFITA